MLTTSDNKEPKRKPNKIFKHCVYYIHNNTLLHAMCSCATHRLRMTTKKYKCLSNLLWIQSSLSGNIHCGFLEGTKLCLGIFPCLLVCLNSLNVYQRTYWTQTPRQMNALSNWNSCFFILSSITQKYTLIAYENNHYRKHHNLFGRYHAYDFLI